jgi:nucleoside-diphosphate-sugar epimerase
MASVGRDDLNILTTGAGGFIGQALTSALLSDPRVSHITMTDVIEPTLPSHIPKSEVQIRCVKADLTSPGVCGSLFTPDLTLIYLLHGVMSGAAEADLELGLKVNIDSTRQILDLTRKVNPGVKVIYPSSLAVYGPPKRKDSYITELNAPLPDL